MGRTFSWSGALRTHCDSDISKESCHKEMEEASLAVVATMYLIKMMTAMIMMLAVVRMMMMMMVK